MSQWQIADQPELDRMVISNAALGCAWYLPHWSRAQVSITHSPLESGIHAELLSCHLTSTCTYTLCHAVGPGETPAPEYLLEVWVENCLVAKIQLPFAFGEQLQHTLLQKRNDIGPA